ncbi:pectate lyase superfamily protein-domain-containing protein [Zopfochytrium polystomum]|nr:pectate lyase superfamily protein-domain-containing protein [Zopfochytrium polystomum]
MTSARRIAMAYAIAVAAAALVVPTGASAASNSTFWFANIARQGSVAYASPEAANYTIFRNVLDFGAKGDGVADDTAAINAAISAGNRCGQGCDSSTTTPAIVYFPAGTYLLSAPLVQYYYTMMIGDATNPPVLKAQPWFQGIAVIDADPYGAQGNWFTNQNNFFRQIRNFVIDLTAMPPTSGTGIHWQIAQATSLQNIVFKMRTDKGTVQQGIFMENGSGGFFADLVFIGGKFGMWVGNQQFTTRNLTFSDCETAVYLNWDWGWTLKSLKVTNCTTGLDISQGGPNAQSVGSAIVLDSAFYDTPVAIRTAFVPDQGANPWTPGSLIIDNTFFSHSTPVAVQITSTGATVPGNQRITLWGQGRSYKGKTGTRIQGAVDAALVPTKPAVLLDHYGNIRERSKPQYTDTPVAKFVSVKSKGAKGDGVADDTHALQAALDGLKNSEILYIDHGAYLLTSTLFVPKTAQIVGEFWPLLVASGPAFANVSSPQVVVKVGNEGDVGNVQISDVILETRGSLPGAILMQWNVQGRSAGDAGLWDVHFRIGGTAGTQQQSDTCAK